MEPTVDKQRVETRLLKVLGHPLRWRILARLNESAASPSVIAAEFDEPLGNVAYHVKVLERYDAIELVGTRAVRGATEHTYRAIERPMLDDDHFARLPVSTRRELLGSAAEDIVDHLIEAAAQGGLDDPRAHISWTTLDLDEQGYADVAELLAATLERALEINAESAGRLATAAEGAQPTRRTELNVMHYARPRRSELE